MIQTTAGDSIMKLTVITLTLLASTPTFAAPLTEYQKNAGCSIVDGQLYCPSPGTGLCWQRGHNPYLNPNKPARAVEAYPGSFADKPGTIVPKDWGKDCSRSSCSDIQKAHTDENE
jgi:hypothetical protein